VGAQDPQAPQPTFRARVDLIQVDVSVLGRDRHPVSGLTAADFTLMEDGRPRPIVSFTEVHVPPPAALTAGWMADIAPDVTTNTQPPRRLVVIAIDDGALSTNGGLWGVQKARAAARAAGKVLAGSHTTSTRELDPSLFAKGRAFDHRFDLPRNLAPGEYLFTVDIAADGKTAERTLRFRIR
jgi:hypothetical protein